MDLTKLVQVQLTERRVVAQQGVMSFGTSLVLNKNNNKKKDETGRETNQIVFFPTKIEELAAGSDEKTLFCRRKRREVVPESSRPERVFEEKRHSATFTYGCHASLRNLSLISPVGLLMHSLHVWTVKTSDGFFCLPFCFRLRSTSNLTEESNSLIAFRKLRRGKSYADN